MATIRVKLTFPEHLIRQPILARLVQDFGVLPDIRRADIKGLVGWIVCELEADVLPLEQALSSLISQGVRVDRLGDVVES